MTLSAIFTEPTLANVRWEDIISLFLYLGAEMKEGSGSRVRFSLNGVHGVFHRPHPNPQVTKPALEDIRKFLITAGIKDEEYG